MAGGVRIWIVADKGREWPDYNLTALLVRKDLYDNGVRTMRELKGRKIGVTQIGSTFHYNVGRYLEKEGMAPGDVELVPLQALPALNDALAAKRVDAVATAEPFVSPPGGRRGRGDDHADRRHLPVADRHRDVLRRSSPRTASGRWRS